MSARDQTKATGARDRRPLSVLTIAGSDSGGGAGIQADLKTFAAHAIHGLSAITAVTAQNTRAVTAVHALPTAMIERQLDAVFDDFRIAAVKIGMLGTARITRAVARTLARRAPTHIVLDPVMIASSGARLLASDAIDALRNALLPLATLITPNLPEAELLTGLRLRDTEDMTRCAYALREAGAHGVLLKGGHLPRGAIVDLYVDAHHELRIRHARLRVEGHGTGCTLASAVAARLALGHDIETAVRGAVAYVHSALRHGTRPGLGSVCVLDHFWAARGAS
jgi:hydroxymethylpyrimidine/phosphomethylpyrimidine kinase